MNEEQIVSKINEMCIESLSPDVFEKWEEVKSQLESIRKDLKQNPVKEKQPDNRECPKCKEKTLLKRVGSEIIDCVTCGWDSRLEKN